MLTATINCKLFQEAQKWYPDECDCPRGRLRNRLLPNKTPRWPYESIAPLWTAQSVQWIITHAEKHSFRNGIFKGEEGGGEGGIPLQVKWLKDYHNKNNTHSIERHNIFTEDNINFPQCGHQYAIQPCCEMNPFYSIPVVTWPKLQ